jgi:hypothetical protein
VLRAIALKTLTLPLSLSKGEAPFQCPARVCVARTPLKEMEPVALALTSGERYLLASQ